MPDFVAGKSLAPILDDVATEVKDAAISQFPRRSDGQKWMGYALRTNRYRYIAWIDTKTGNVTDRELYDHTVDPEENDNIAADPRSEQRVEALHAKLWSVIPEPAFVREKALNSAP